MDAMIVNGLYGAFQADKKEKQALETLSDAWDMKNESRQILAERKKLAIQACQVLCKRKNATIQNIVEFKDDLQIIIDLGLIIEEEELLDIKEINIQRIEKYQNYLPPLISPKSNMQNLVEAINPFTGGIGGTMIREAERTVQRADFEWDMARLEEKSNLAEAEIYEQIAKLSNMQKEILAKLNQFFNCGCKYVHEVIQKNGTKKANYSQEEREKITVVVQCAKCMNAVLSTELMNEEYKITEQARKLMDTTEKFMKKSMGLI